MKTFRQTVAVLALACIAPLAQAFTLSVAPSSVQVGETAVLQLDGSFTDVYAFDVLVTFAPTLVDVGAGALISPTEARLRTASTASSSRLPCPPLAAAVNAASADFTASVSREARTLRRRSI